MSNISRQIRKKELGGGVEGFNKFMESGKTGKKEEDLPFDQDIYKQAKPAHVNEEAKK